ncbi:MAG: class I SAM-dependent methyltransferase [Clostridiaceae bacterium]
MHKFNIKNMEKLDNPQRRKMMPPEETLLKFNIQDDGTFLDIGCGIGYFTIAASNIIKANKIIGIDIMPDMLEVAKERAEGIDNIEFKTCEEYSFPIDEHSVKYIMVCNVIHEIKDKIRYFNEIKRVLTEEGSLLIIDWDKKEMEVGPPTDERISKDEMIAICSASGLKLIEEVAVSSNHYGLKINNKNNQGYI